MNRKLYLTVLAALIIGLMPLEGVGQDLAAASENEKTRLNKDEIMELMIQVDRLPVLEQNSRMDRIWKDPSGSRTPRSDFLFCMGLAYLGNYKAQAYLGRAYENGRGIVEDTYESYVWYSIALDNAVDDDETKQKIQERRERIKMGMISVYPAPSDHELGEIVEAQKNRITESLAEIKK